MGGFGQVLDGFLSQLLNVPLINPLSYVYVFLNFLLLVWASFFGGGTALF